MKRTSTRLSRRDNVIYMVRREIHTLFACVGGLRQWLTFLCSVLPVFQVNRHKYVVTFVKWIPTGGVNIIII